MTTSVPPTLRDQPVTRSEIVLVALAVLIGLAVRVYFFTGLIASDDLTHAHASHYLFTPAVKLPFEDSTAGSVVVRRIGVNIPLAVSIALFGTHEWSLALVPLGFSLAGILFAYGLARVVAGGTAGVLAAWLWALLPADIYTATAWLQDNIFASGYMLFLFAFAAGERWPRRRWGWGLLAGAAVGYLEYVKETAVLNLGVLALWAVWTYWRERRVTATVWAALLGFMLVQVLAACFFQARGGSFFGFWPTTFYRFVAVQADERVIAHRFPANLNMLWRYFVQQWVFGYGVVLLPLVVLALFWLRDAFQRRVLRLVVLAALLQSYILFVAVQVLNWTQRYTLQVSPLFVVCLALAVAAAAERLGGRVRPVAVTMLSLLLIALTGGALREDRQQHGYSRAVVVREAFRYLKQVAGEEDPIFVDRSDLNLPTYTGRALEMLAGFQPFKGGFHHLRDAYAAERGWVVRTHLEDGHMHMRGDDAAFRGQPPHWVEVFHARTPAHSRYYAQVYRVFPPDQAPAIRTVLSDWSPPAYVPFVERALLQPMVPAQGPAGYVSRRWRGKDTDVVVKVEDGAITGSLRSEREPALGGIQLSVPGMQALRFSLDLPMPEAVEGLYVYAYNEAGDVMRWQLRFQLRHKRRGVTNPLTFVPGEPSGPFRLSGALAPEDIRTVHIFLRAKPGLAVPLRVYDITLQPAAVPPALPEHVQAVSVDFDQAPAHYQGRRRGIRAYTIEGVPHGLRCRFRADPDGPERQYGGLGFDVSGPAVGLTCDLSLCGADAIDLFWIEARDAQRQRVAAWYWRPSARQPAPDWPQRHVLVFGQGAGPFTYEQTVAGDIADQVARFEFGARVRSGEAGLLLRHVALLVPRDTSVSASARDGDE